MNIKKKYFLWAVTFFALVCAITTIFCVFWYMKPDPEKRHLEVVKFGVLPYADHCFAKIGVDKGWFEEVGLDVQLISVEVPHIMPYLKNEELDVCSCPPGILISNYDSASDLCCFVFSDLFQGYAIMARPTDYRSYQDFRKAGLSSEEAARQTLQQLKGKRFAYPPETAIKPFIDLIFKKGGLQLDDMTTLPVSDLTSVQAMRYGTCDFQAGGAPSRVTLEQEGFRPIITAKDFTDQAAPSAKSIELACILQNGWITRKKLYKEKEELFLKLASVNYRIMKYIASDRDEAARIHMAYLSKLTGNEFTAEDAPVFYDRLDPFYTFKQQSEWFHDKKSPLYYKYINGAIINSWIKKEHYRKQPPDVEDVIFADDVYYKLETLRTKADDHFTKINNQDLSSANEELRTKLNKAEQCYAADDFFSAEKLTNEVLTQLKTQR